MKANVRNSTYEVHCGVPMINVILFNCFGMLANVIIHHCKFLAIHC